MKEIPELEDLDVMARTWLTHHIKKDRQAIKEALLERVENEVHTTNAVKKVKDIINQILE